MPIIIDPAVRILPDDNKIFVLHPGKQKRFYRDFLDTESVFLDFPGITFDTAPKINDATTRSMLRMARRISNWRRRGAPENDEPSRNPADYVVADSTITPRYLHEAVALYDSAKAGDLVIIPGKGYDSTVFFGEFINDSDLGFAVETPRYPSEQVPARRVKWLPVSLKKGQFDTRLIRLMQNRQAIINVTREDDRRDVYSRAYGNYVWKESSGNLIRVTKSEIDLNDLNKAVDLTNYFACQYIALTKGELGKFLELPFNEAIDIYYDKSFFGGVSVEIHSPGYFDRPMKGVIMAGYVSVMLALSAASVTADEGAKATIVNSANPVVSVCDQQLQRDVRQTMEMYMNIQLWEKELCPRRAAAKESVGLTTDVKVNKAP